MSPALPSRRATLPFGYDAGRPLYEGFSLAVHPGERVALRAPSGFGKTTLCRLLAGYEVPQKGSVLVDGSPLARTGACPVQLIGQQPDAVVDPLLRMERTLAEAGSVDERLCEALGIQTRLDAPVPARAFRRRAAALLHRPRAHGAPRATWWRTRSPTMLDAVTQAQLWEFLLEEAERRALGLVFVSHAPALTERIATRVVELA